MRKTVLIADNELNLLLSLEYLMKREGYRVMVARDGHETLEMIRSEKPDLVLLDVMLPHKTGFDVCQEVRADADLRDMLIIMLTARSRDTDMAKGKALGANDYIIKPFATRELLQKVSDMLAGTQ